MRILNCLSMTVVATAVCVTGCVSRVATKKPADSEIKTHALAFNAILDSQNGYYHSILSVTPDPTSASEQPEKIRNMLADSWDVNSRQDLLNLLARIESGENGHRGRYWRFREKFLSFPIESRGNVYLGTGPDEAPSAHIVDQQIRAPLGRAMPITAWDFGRYISLCRAGYNIGWMSDKEAWERILPVARMLQASYGSWDEFAADYLVGRDFWDPSTVPENEKIRYLIMMLERPDGGLWASIPWNESLGEGPIMVDPMAAALLKDYKPRNQNFPGPNYSPPGGSAIIAVRTGVDPK